MQLWRVLKIISNSNKNRPIGFFDSGVGGLTVMEQFRKILPAEDCIYFGDTKNMPYGEKTQEQLINFSDSIFKFFESQGVKAVVMACNTSSAVTYNVLKDKYNFKIYPIIQSVTEILAQLPVSKLGVFATNATINSHAYRDGILVINPNIKVFEHACPQWVKIVEERREHDQESIDKVKADLECMLKFLPDKIVLGCTHYPYLINILKTFVAEDIFINPAIAFAEYIKNDLSCENLLCNDKIGFEKFYVSGHPHDFINAASIFYNIKKMPEQVKLA